MSKKYRNLKELEAKLELAVDTLEIQVKQVCYDFEHVKQLAKEYQESEEDNE